MSKSQMPWKLVSFSHRHLQLSTMKVVRKSLTLWLIKCLNSSLGEVVHHQGTSNKRAEETHLFQNMRACYFQALMSRMLKNQSLKAGETILKTSHSMMRIRLLKRKASKLYSSHPIKSTCPWLCKLKSANQTNSCAQTATNWWWLMESSTHCQAKNAQPTVEWLTESTAKTGSDAANASTKCAMTASTVPVDTKCRQSRLRWLVEKLKVARHVVTI